MEYLESARKSFKKIAPQQRRRIRGYLEERVISLENPRRLGKPLKGEFAKFWRYRVGDYRLICQLQDKRLLTRQAFMSG
ncbi:type II toxin-antitoxin system RelE family toxin [Pistricoccus aurantiacus]|uniref:type II toxin-antitoxin system RelE family toxin n=1 Tax=Pistricoccus aurantiacus TaxID=1883414 RepID=UPI001C95131E